MLNPAALGYQDVVDYLRQAESGGQASILKTIFGEAGSEAILVQWLADADDDAAIADKEATGELYRLGGGRLGASLGPPTGPPSRGCGMWRSDWGGSPRSATSRSRTGSRATSLLPPPPSTRPASARSTRF